MPPNQRKNKFPNIPPVLSIMILIITIVFIILTYITFATIFHSNIYGDEIKITNLEQSLPKLNTDQKDLFSSQLYNVIKDNTSDNTDFSNITATIRTNTLNITENSNDYYSGTFIIDIEQLQQSYYIRFNFPQSNNLDASDSGIVISCPPSEYIIYQNQKCMDNSSIIITNWTNAYQLEYTFGTQVALYIQKALDNYFTSIISDVSYLEVTIDPSSFRALDEDTNLYELNLNLSNGQVFHTIIQSTLTRYNTDVTLYAKNTASNNYLATIITDDPDNAHYAESWLRTYLNLPNLQITVQTPEELTEETS